MSLVVPFDDGYLQTNPVWSIEQILLLLDFDRNWSDASRRLARIIQSLQATGIHLPAEALSDLMDRGYLEPDVSRALEAGALDTGALEAGPAKEGNLSRVIGLFVDRRTTDGFVVPIEATVADEWECSPMLPFRVTDVQDQLHRLLSASGTLHAGHVPERWSFRIQERLGNRVHGGSMTLAAVLAVLDAASGWRAAPLERVAVVVEATANDQLRTTEFVRPKLEAFIREYRRGTLLVRHPECSEGDRFDQYFEHVWVVGDHQALGRRLAESGLFDPLLRKVPVSQHQLRQVVERMNYLERVALRYEEALDLAQRVKASVSLTTLSTWECYRPLEFLGNLQRHLGQFAAAMETSRRLIESLEAAEEGTSHDDVALAVVAYAASLFDAHHFQDACDVLRPWCHRAEEDSRLLKPTTRVALQNTLGRARVVLLSEDWRTPFRRSLDLQRRHDRPGLARTWNYWLLAHLRLGHVAEVRAGLAEQVPVMEGDDFSRWMGAYIRAELARQEGRKWHDPELEQGERPPGTPGHPWGFYFQATARQPDCPDAANRFRLAAECFGNSVGGEPTILAFYGECMHLASSAVERDQERWHGSREALLKFVEHPDSLGVKRYYESVLGKLEAGPSLELSEELLSRLPFL